MTERPIQTENGEADHLERRRKTHGRLADELDASSDEELLHLLSDEQTLEKGNAVVSLPKSDTKVFAKLVPLTAREMLPENRGSSSNLFRLPTCYQYRVGSCAGGAWRELEAQACGSEWVLSGDNSGFPLLHHWRLLPIVRTGYDDKLNVGPWGGCPEIRERLLELNQATSSLVLFIEYFPFTLTQWLRKQLSDHDEPAVLVAGIEKTCRELLAFIRARGVLHLDAHFDNILTDGVQFYLSDFGLALSRGFQLGSDEVQFFDKHTNFDSCTAINSLVHAIVTRYDPRHDWRQSLRDMSDGESGSSKTMPVAMRAYVARTAPLALMIGEFYAQLMKDPATPYPAAALQELLDRR